MVIEFKKRSVTEGLEDSRFEKRATMRLEMNREYIEESEALV